MPVARLQANFSIRTTELCEVHIYTKYSSSIHILALNMVPLSLDFVVTEMRSARIRLSIVEYR